MTSFIVEAGIIGWPAFTATLGWRSPRQALHSPRMTLVLNFLLVLALLGVLTVLGFGVTSMLRGGDPRRSNKLMQARVLMQGLALLLLALLMLLSRR